MAARKFKQIMMNMFFIRVEGGTAIHNPQYKYADRIINWYNQNAYGNCRRSNNFEWI